jgi:O-antigen ligase
MKMNPKLLAAIKNQIRRVLPVMSLLTMGLAAASPKISGMAFWVLFLVCLFAAFKPMHLDKQGRRAIFVLSIPILADLVFRLGHGFAFNQYSLLPLSVCPVLLLGLLRLNPNDHVRASRLGAWLGCFIGGLASFAMWVALPTGERIAPFGINALLYAVLMSYMVLLSMLQLSPVVSTGSLGDKAFKVMPIFASTVGVAAIFLTGARTAILAAAVWLSLLAGQSGRSVFRFGTLKFYALAGVVVLILGISFVPVASRITSTFGDFFTWQAGDQKHTSTRARAELVLASVLMVKQAPWFGTGAQSFSKNLDALRTMELVPSSLPAYQHAHSTYLTLLVEVGIVGTLIWLSALIWLTRFLFKARSASGWMGLMTLLLSALLSFFTDLFAHQGSLRILSLLVALSLASVLSTSHVLSRPA